MLFSKYTWTITKKPKLQFSHTGPVPTTWYRLTRKTSKIALKKMSLTCTTWDQPFWTSMTLGTFTIIVALGSIVRSAKSSTSRLSRERARLEVLLLFKLLPYIQVLTYLLLPLLVLHPQPAPFKILAWFLVYQRSCFLYSLKEGNVMIVTTSFRGFM